MNAPNLLVIPGSPTLVRELAPAHEPSRALAGTIRGAVEQYPPRPIHIVGSRDTCWHTAHTGSLAAWGARQVALQGGNHLPELVARYVLGDPEVTDSRERIRPLDPRALTVVVVDGPAGLTERAPLALIPGAREAHEALRDFLGGGGFPGALEGVVEKQLWLELAVLGGEKELLASDDSLGVGAYVAQWWC
ncbi:hypothetical protein M3G47_04125 [Corynebacterium sanguinis]|uniref:hypothetical protein n=1 Tax=Corynebacterium sanguinis TaxID=2594913 RepID=UPI0021A7F1E3|nr:hypothetical protein [Corynebacterium sanguinis]MCT1411018.1 hypothetical protein [Corynebacterium sanguinis]MCT1492341.1 hypothetical protein [Corynebacterium sanguinis]MCT2247278.1 hypothetical protein [Corynebacterium sanguinis]